MFLKACFLLAVAWGGLPYLRGAAPSESFPHVLQLSPFLTVYWKVGGDTITFEVHAEWHGWVSIGFSQTGKMFPADVVIGLVPRDGTFTIIDGMTHSYQSPTLDSQTDYFLDSSRSDDRGVVMKFHRSLDTHDPNDMVITDGFMHLIWAYGQLQPATHKPQYHGHSNRGYIDVNLRDPHFAIGK